MKRYSMLTGVGCVLVLAAACGDEEIPGNGENGENEEEVISTVILDFAPAAGSGASPVQAIFRDGNVLPMAQLDSITLEQGETYNLSVRLQNETEDPAEEVTEEIEEEDDEHQLFFTGSAVGSLVQVAYADADENGRPVGLENVVTTLTTGSEPGGFRVTLKHQPPVNGTPQKTDTSGINDGGTDVEVDFDLTVN